MCHGAVEIPLAGKPAAGGSHTGRPVQLHHWALDRAQSIQWENSRFFNKKAFAQANAFYDRYGGTTIIIARFMPFMRTFVPFVAGVAEMSRSKFTFFNVTGGFIWVVGVTAAGYFFGNIDWVQKNLSVIIWGLILVPGVLALFGAWKAGRKKTA